jgi:hypothetical protein
MITPQVGDVILVSRWDPFALAIKFTQYAAGYGRESRINHWQIVTEVLTNGDVVIIEASLGGVRERQITLRGHTEYARPTYTDVAAAITAAREWAGTPYGFLDIPALLANILDWHPRWAERILRRPTTIVCSQLGAYAAYRGGDRFVSEFSWPRFIPAMSPSL